MHECQKQSHLIPMDKSKFMCVEFYGASTDKMFQFFYERPGFSGALDEMKGVDIVVNMCMSCFASTQDKIKKGMVFI